MSSEKEVLNTSPPWLYQPSDNSGSAVENKSSALNALRLRLLLSWYALPVPAGINRRGNKQHEQPGVGVEVGVLGDQPHKAEDESPEEGGKHVLRGRVLFQQRRGARGGRLGGGGKGGHRHRQRKGCHRQHGRRHDA